MISGIVWATTGITLVAGIIGFIAASIEIRDSLDQFMGDLRRQGRWARAGAAANLVGVAGLIASQVLPLLQH